VPGRSDPPFARNKTGSGKPAESMCTATRLFLLDVFSEGFLDFCRRNCKIQALIPPRPSTLPLVYPNFNSPAWYKCIVVTKNRGNPLPSPWVHDNTDENFQRGRREWMGRKERGREISLFAGRHVCRSKRERKKRRPAPFEMTVWGPDRRKWAAGVPPRGFQRRPVFQPMLQLGPP